MNSPIPLPTDNIYKFCAMFGLALIITSLVGALYYSETTNDRIYFHVLELDRIDKEATPQNLPILQKFLEKRIEIAANNRKVVLGGLSVVLGLGIFICHYGFRKWKSEVQPLHDEMLRLQLKKLKREINDSDA